MQKKIAYGGLTTALCVIMIVGSAYLPTGKAALLFMASFAVYLLTLCTDKKTAGVCYAASSIVIFLITSFTNPLITVSFVLCFGNYPILKTLFEKCKLVLAIILKFLAYTVYFCAVYYSVTILFDVVIPYAVFVLYLGGVVAFAFYDFLLSYTGKYAKERFFKSF